MRPSRLVAIALYAVCALYGLPATAQNPIAALSGKTDSAVPASIESYARAETGNAEAAAQARLAAIETGGDHPADVPPGTPSYEMTGRLALMRQLVSLYPKQHHALQRLEAARRRRDEIQRAMEAWSGFDEPPPRSVLLIDALRDDLDAAEVQLAAARDGGALLERLETEFQAKVKASQGDARLAAEAADRGRDMPTSARLEWQRNLSALEAEVDSATQALLQLTMRATKAEYDAALAQRDFARHKLIAAGEAIAVSSADLGKIYADIEQRRVVAESALEAAKGNAKTAQAALGALESQLAAERAGLIASGAGAARSAESDRELLAAREVAATANQQLFLLRDSLNVLQGERTVWEARAAALSVRDPVQARTAYRRLIEGLAGLSATRQYLERQLADTAARIRDAEGRLRLVADRTSLADRRLLDTLREREAHLSRALEEMAPLERLLVHFRADFQGRGDITLLERSKDLFASALLVVRQVWNYEMFAIEDTMQTADGRRVSVSRSVTVGKTFGAVLILVFGYLLSSWVLRWIERSLVAARRATMQGAALVRKWILFVLAAGLTIVALFSASIPLTAFAFLGGALAIAAGFGLQTLMKNLVSGVMLLLERPLRLGDLVDVDGIRGRITEIGLRASTIRSADGTESMVPNSRFLEGNMTNWTYSAPATRHTIEVGVAYGSPLRKVNEILNAVLQRHGLLVKDPAPQVYLDGYGDSSINFALTYWVEMTEGTDSRRIKSDLLHMIDRAFEEAGVVIPFPQRDVRLMSSEPVPVAIVNSAPARALALS